jgi:hypothetical protein
MKELRTMGKKTGENKGHRKTKAALAAGAVASCVAATAAYRRRNSRDHLGSDPRPTPTGFGAGPNAGPGDTQPL